MAFDGVQANSHLKERGRPVFQDFITGLQANNEIEFSAALAVLHSWRRIDWKKVHLRSGSESSLDAPVIADELIPQDALALCEYPLFSTPGSNEEKQWGAFRADILFLARDRNRIAYVENKIGAKIRADMITGTMRCLDRSRLNRACFILLTGREFLKAGWYSGN